MIGLLYGLVCVGFFGISLICSNALILRNERSKKHLSLTTNGQTAFKMSVQTVQPGLFFDQLSGPCKGVTVSYHDVIYLDNQKQRVPLRVYRVALKQDGLIQISIAKGHKALWEKGCWITNVREESQLDQTKRAKYHQRHEMAVTYPICFRAAGMAYLSAIGILLMGLLELLLCFANVAVDGTLLVSHVILFALGTFFTVFGCYRLFSHLLYCLKVHSNFTLEVVGLAKSKTYRRNQYQTSLQIQRSFGKENYAIRIFEKHHQKAIAVILDRDPHFWELFAVIQKGK